MKMNGKKYTIGLLLIVLIGVVLVSAGAAAQVASLNGPGSENYTQGQGLTAEQAIEKANMVARSFGESAPVLVSVNGLAYSAWIESLKARAPGEDVAVAQADSVLQVKLTGVFKPRSGPINSERPKYSDMIITMDTETGGVLSVGLREQIPAE